MQQVPRRRLDRLPAALGAIAFLAWSSSAVADEFGTPEPAPDNCLARASLMVNRGEALVIQLFDGRRIDGNLVSFDLDNQWAQWSARAWTLTAWTTVVQPPASSSAAAPATIVGE